MKKTNNLNTILQIFKFVFFIAIFFSIVLLIIYYSQGYRVNIREKTLNSTGVLVLRSAPKQAKVFIKNKEKGLTNIDIQLPPEKYDVSIEKEGYFPWKKEIRLQGEAVRTVDAVLFPKNPGLTPLTNTGGVLKAISIPKIQKTIIFAIVNQQEKNDPKNGIYLFDNNKGKFYFSDKDKKLFPIFSEVKLLASFNAFSEMFLEKVNIDTVKIDSSIENDEFLFSYQDKNEINLDETPKTHNYLISLKKENQNLKENEILIENTEEIVKSVQNLWAKNEKKYEKEILSTLPKEIQSIATISFKKITFSPDKTKFFYIANSEASIGTRLKNLLGSNETAEERQIKKNRVYVYDIKEDKNFLLSFDEKKINTDPYYLQWYTSSNHFIINENNEINIVDYDGNNKQILYSGQYDNTYLAVNNDWKLIILSNQQKNTFSDLYQLEIR